MKHKLQKNICHFFKMQYKFLKSRIQEKFLSLVVTGFLRINSCRFFLSLKHLMFGGPHGEMGASMRYLAQRFSMPNGITKATLTDIGVSTTKLPLNIKKVNDTTNPTPFTFFKGFILLLN